jgi:hypothetical protein
MKSLCALIMAALVIILCLSWQPRPAACSDCVYVCVTMTPTAAPTLQPTSTPTRGPSATPAPASAKKGVVFTGPGTQETFDSAILGAGWWYSYHAQNTGLQASFVPMVRPGYDPAIVQWMARRLASHYVLVLNEPDRSDQDNITPAQGATLYHAVRDQVLAWDAEARFIVGNVSNIDYYGFTWLRDMAVSYQAQYGEAMPVAGWGVHIYDCTSAQQRWRDKLQMFVNWQRAAGMGGELWVTELGCLNSDAAVLRIMNEQTAWLNTTPLIARYAWFATRNDTGSGSLLNTNGILTTLGRIFISQ